MLHLLAVFSLDALVHRNEALMVHFLDLREFRGLSLVWKKVEEDIFLLLIHGHSTPLLIERRCGCEWVRIRALLCFRLLLSNLWIEVTLSRADG